MLDINKTTVCGNLGRKPELRFTTAGTAVTTLSMATNEVYKDSEGNQKKRTTWHRVVVWGKQAENCCTYLDKGRRIYVEGKLQTRQWKDDTGSTRYVTEIVANQGTGVQFADPRPQEKEVQQNLPSLSEDDIQL